MEGRGGASKTTLALAAGGCALVVYVAAKQARNAMGKSSRKAAGSPFEFHVAVHFTGSDGKVAKPTLVKVHKTASLDSLKKAVGAALNISETEVPALRLAPVLRGRRQDSLAGCLTEEYILPKFEMLLENRRADELQIVELAVSVGGDAPLLPPPLEAFSTPSPWIPFVGHMWALFLGREFVPTYNLTNRLFPPTASKYPFGATIRTHNGGITAPIADFPAGTVFHKDAHEYMTWTADADIVREVLERTPEFPKLWNRKPQKLLQDFTGNGLFTSSETNEDWASAHSILPRSFNQIKIKSYAPKIFAKTRAFLREWSCLPAGTKVQDVNHWLTAMTADAVVSCSMGLDMGNVERMGAGQDPHPFVNSFRDGLGIATTTINAKKLFGWKRFLPGFNAQKKVDDLYETSKKTLQDMIEGMVEQTRSGELGQQNSVIRAMLQDKAASGKHVRYHNLYAQVVNLMIAGHETTAATLGFTMQLIAENPEVEAKALAEVHAVLGGRTEPMADDVPKLVYIEQCFREALRLYSPVTILSRDAAYDTLLAGKRVYQGERLNIVTRALHTNPEYWGGEFGCPYSFNPERFAPEAVKKRHANAYHPWGMGTRSCIGSQFALFEAKTFLASMLLHFKFVPVPGYKVMASSDAGGAAPSPHKLELIVYPRPGGPVCGDDGRMVQLPVLAAVETSQGAALSRAPSLPRVNSGDGGAPMVVLYGSNAGACQEFASAVANGARKRGFSVTMTSLDQALGDKSITRDGKIVVIITSTYNGNPPENATKFKAWLMGESAGSLSGVRYAVFGVGNSQWQTYQQFPREVDAALERCGATRIHNLGACDVDSATFDSDFDDWHASFLRTVGGAKSLEVADDIDPDEEEAKKEFEVHPSRTCDIDAKQCLEDMAKAKMTAAKAVGASIDKMIRSLEIAEPSRELCQDSSARSVRHVTLRLPEGCKYRAGDHLEVCPPNNPELVKMTLAALGLHGREETTWHVSKSRRSTRNSPEEELKSKIPPRKVNTGLVLTWLPDLSSVPNRKMVGKLAKYATTSELKEKMKKISSDAATHKEEILDKQLTLACLAHKHKDNIKMSLGEFCAVAKPLAPRYYSVSSSPDNGDPRIVTVSAGQVKFKTASGRVHKGLASTALGAFEPGMVLPGCVHQLTGHFHCPDDPMAPMIMVGPGTGLAPMMGFLQERAAKIRSGAKLGPAILFFGCRKSDEDYLYKEELAAFKKSGALTELHVAFSREGAQKVYVQDVIMDQKNNVWKLLQDPASCVYVCGDARAMAPDVRRAFQRVAEECGGKSEAKAQSMISAMVEGNRYLEDVWAS